MKLPDKKYSVIYADPPWSYRQHGTGPKSRGNAAQHYHTMTTEDICALPIRQLAGGARMCAVHVGDISASGRCAPSYGSVGLYIHRKSNTPFWGMGAYTRANEEICLLRVTPDFRPAAQIKSHAVHQIIEAPIMAHSVKPDETRRRIVQLLGDVPRIELFARQCVPGWDAWGDEITE